MDYDCVEARFLFNDGVNRYTVEYCFGLRTWYVFKGDERGNALYKVPITKKHPVNTRVDIARSYLYDYLNSMPENTLQ